MKIHKDIEQKGWQWMCLRAGKITASEIGNLVTDKGEVRKWTTAMPQSYLHRKLAEKWRGHPLESFQGNRQTDQGVMYEATARNYFAALLEADIAVIGGIESDDGRLWASPDGVIGGESAQAGLEIKCTNADTHIGWLLEGGLPAEHRLQVQFSLYVSGWDGWHFLSYCKDLPHLAVEVERDPVLQETMEVAVGEFCERLDAAWKVLCEKNGGEPERRAAPAEPLKFSWETQDGPVDYRV